MATTTHRETAKIYTFQPRSRTSAESFVPQANSVVTLRQRRANVAIDAWYHQAAVIEAENESKN